MSMFNGLEQLVCIVRLSGHQLAVYIICYTFALWRIKRHPQRHSANVQRGTTTVKNNSQGTRQEKIYEICSGAVLEYYLANIKSPVHVSIHFYILVEQVLDLWQKKTQM
jgi:hypothetical protein